MKMTDRARQAVSTAHSSASSCGELHVTSDHLLGALFTDPQATAAKIFRALGIRHADLFPAPTRRGHPEAALDHVPFDAHAKQAMEYALTEALELKHRHIGTGHILLGLIRDNQNPVVARLNSRNLSTATLRQQAIAMINSERSSGTSSPTPQ